MHTTSYNGDIHFLHNGDYSGDVIIQLPTEAAETTLHNDGHTSMKIPYTALEFLVTQRVASELIGGLEDAGTMTEVLEVLRLFKGNRKDPGDMARLGFVRALANLDTDIEARRRETLQHIVNQAKELLK